MKWFLFYYLKTFWNLLWIIKRTPRRTFPLRLASLDLKICLYHMTFLFKIFKFACADKKTFEWRGEEIRILSINIYALQDFNSTFYLGCFTHYDDNIIVCDNIYWWFHASGKSFSISCLFIALFKYFWSVLCYLFYLFF